MVVGTTLHTKFKIIDFLFESNIIDNEQREKLLLSVLTSPEVLYDTGTDESNDIERSWMSLGQALLQTGRRISIAEVQQDLT